ncbi:protein kinase [bacterium]|nr:protein kinase [bacterium]
MTPQRWKKVEKVYSAARELAPPDRDAFLKEACKSDAALRQEVESLLKHEVGAKEFLESPALEVAAGMLMQDQMQTTGKIGSYHILSLLGTGGMGEVYLTQDSRLGRKVALKLLPKNLTQDTDTIRRFEREARAASALNHPNILTIYEIGRAEETHYIATEFVEGETLRQRMLGGKMDLNQVLDIAIQTANALAAAHEAGIVHRDIKPENIMVRRDGLVKVLDFGLAKLIEPKAQFVDRETATVAELKTDTGMVIGTARYMSPEQARGQTTDARTDLFSLGVLIYEMLASMPPFRGDNHADVIAALLTTEPPPLSQIDSEIPAELDSIVSKALRKNAAERYQTAKELLNDLHDFRGGFLHVQASAESKSNRTGFAVPTGSRLRLWIYGIAIVLIVTSTFIIFQRNPARMNRNKPGRATLAVMPFHISTPEPSISYLSVGIPDAIITRLSNLEQIQLRPTSSILAFQNKHFEIEEVREKLEVENILTGTIQKIGDRFRIRVQLIRAADGVSLWGFTYDLSPSDLLTIEDSVSEQVSSALQLQISPQQRVRLKQAYTENTEAYQWYVRGREQLPRYTSQSALTAISYFEKALQLDPSFAKARAGLAQAAADMHLRLGADEEAQFWGNRALEEAQQALRIDSNLAEANEAMAAVYRKTEFKWDLTIQESNKALALNNSLYLPHYFKAAAYYHYGLFDLAEEELIAAKRANVSDQVEAFRTQAVIDFFRGRFSDVIKNLEEVQRLTGKAIADWHFSLAHYYSGNAGQAETVLREMMTVSYGGTATRAKATLAAILAQSGRREEAQKWLKEALASSFLDHHALYSIGVTYAQLGNHDAAVEWLSRSIEKGFPCYPWFERDPLLDPIRNTESFRNLLSKLKHEFEIAEKRYTNQP